ARHQLGALVDAGLDEALDLFVLGGVDDRAEPGFRTARVADDEALGGRLGDRLHLVVPVGRHEHAGRRGAGLAAIHHHAVDALGDGHLEVDVGQQDVGRLAAELLGDELHRRIRGLLYEDAGAGRAGLSYHTTAGLLHDLSDLPG